MDMTVLFWLVSLAIGTIGLTMCLVKYAMIKLNDLWDDDCSENQQ
jgi:hypothetical protein